MVAYDGYSDAMNGLDCLAQDGIIHVAYVMVVHECEGEKAVSKSRAGNAAMTYKIFCVCVCVCVCVCDTLCVYVCV